MVVEIDVEKNNLPDLIKIVALEENIENYDTEIASGSEKGENYMGEIYMVTVIDKDSERKLHLVVKFAFKDDKVREFAPVQKCYQNECYFYKNILPEYINFQNSKAVKNKFLNYPKCYLSNSDLKNESVVMENLKHKGFELTDKKALLNHDENTLIFQTYAKFHAIGFALKENHPQTYKIFVSNISNIHKDFAKMWSDGVGVLCQRAYKYLEDGEENVRNGFRKYAEHGREIFADLCHTVGENPTIIHADGWSMNLLFKYEKNGDFKKAIDMRILDWQIIREGSTVFDLAYAFYSGNSVEGFENLEFYLNEYHKSLTEMLKDLDCDVQKIFPYETFMAEWKKYAKWGMFLAIFMHQAKLTKKEDTLDLTDFAENGVETGDEHPFLKIKFDEVEYKKRIRGLLLHFDKIGAF